MQIERYLNMRYFVQMNQTMLRMKALQPRIPSWAKAEKMEISTPQVELYKFADEPKKNIIKTVFGGLYGTVKSLLFRLFHET